MSSHIRLWLALALAAGSLGAAAAPAAAQNGYWLYSVDFVCGFQPNPNGPQGYEPLVKVANYATKLDLLNCLEEPLALGTKAYFTNATTWPAAAPGVPIPGGGLPPDTSTVLDCNDIAQAAGGAGPGKPFLNGMVAIRSPKPLVVWATKTTQVCVGYVTMPPAFPWTPFPFQPIFIDDLGQARWGTVTGPVVPAGRVTFNCPAAPWSGFPLPIGPYLGPGGAIPPGTRPPSDIITPSPTPVNPRPNPILPDLSVAHSLDFERVEGLWVEVP